MNGEERQCIEFNTDQAEFITVKVNGITTGSTKFFVYIPTNQTEIDAGPPSELNIFQVQVLKSRNIYILDQAVGWTYIFFWTVSFYPQVIMNWRRKSVIGFNFDYLGYDLTGFIGFALYNCLLLWSPAVFDLYQEKHPGSPNPIRINDVVFCLHAIFIQV